MDASTDIILFAGDIESFVPATGADEHRSGTVLLTLTRPDAVVVIVSVKPCRFLGF